MCVCMSQCVFLRERREYEGHLSFVALLRTQPGSWCVKLLGNDTQKLSLVLCSVAVRRADVHHLERERDADTERRAEERGTEWLSENTVVEKTSKTQQETKKMTWELRSKTKARKDSCAHAWRGGARSGHRVAAHSAVGSTRNILFWWEQQHKCGSASAETVCNTKLCSMHWSAKAVAREGFDLISRLLYYSDRVNGVWVNTALQLQSQLGAYYHLSADYFLN